MYSQIAVSSADMLFSLKSCFLGPCRKALEWEIRWIIYWSDGVRYVAIVYFKTVQNSVQWIAAVWYDFLLIVAFQSLRTKTESIYWSGCWSIFLFSDMACALCVLKAQGLGKALVLSAVSGLVQAGIQLCLRLPEQPTTEEKEELLGKQVVGNPSIQEKNVWIWNILVDSSVRRPLGRTCRGGSCLWSTREG